MLQFILVDSEEETRKKLINVINKVLFDKDIEYTVKEFSSCNNELKRIIRNNQPKVYLLDVKINSNTSGIDIGKNIRKYDLDSEILYVTNHDHMFEKVYRCVYKVFDFIEKYDNMEERVEKDINQIILRKWDKKKYMYSNNRVTYEIYLDNIMYIYRDTLERKVVIKTYDGSEFLINCNINEIMKKLDSRFAQVHRACIVNKDRVRVYNWQHGYFILDNKEKVNMLSKNYRMNIVSEN